MRMSDIPFGTTDWAAITPTEHAGESGNAYNRTREFGGIRVRMVEYTPGYLADHWCEKGHVLLCLEGELLNELADGRTFTLIPGTSYRAATAGSAIPFGNCGCAGGNTTPSRRTRRHASLLRTPMPPSTTGMAKHWDLNVLVFPRSANRADGTTIHMRIRTTVTKIAWMLVFVLLAMRLASAHSVGVAVIDYPVNAAHSLLTGQVSLFLSDGPFAKVNLKDEHGTKVVSVITQNTGSHVWIGSVAWPAGIYDSVSKEPNDCLSAAGECVAGRNLFLREFALYGKLWPLFQIVNSSHGLSPDRIHFSKLEDALLRHVVPQLIQSDPTLWNSFAQADRNPGIRSIHVRSTGNKNSHAGQNPTFNFHRILVHSAPQLWGHTLFVTALDRNEERLLHGVVPCGPVPKNWDSDKHGRHLCVAALGVHCVATPGGGCEDAAGTSYAAPYVSAILAKMYLKCGFGGPRLVKLLLDTANHAPPYQHVETYGAGVVTMERALQACPP